VKLDHLTAYADEHGLLLKERVVPRHLTSSTWSRSIQRGQLITIQPGVAIVRLTERSELQSVAAAVLASGDDALAGGATAAWLHGASIPLLTPLHIITPARPRNRRIIGAMLHRPTDTRDLTPERRQGIPVTPPFRTLLDTAAWTPHFTSNVLEHFLVEDQLNITQAWRGLFAHGRQGRPGISALRTVLQRWALDTEQPESVLEAKMLSLCFVGKLPPFEFQAQLGPYRVDFLWREQRVIAECDGFAFHGSTRERFENDRRRDNYLQSLGYSVWRISFRQIIHEPHVIMQQLRAVFRRESC
jgi:very-short-patch-repair endonuclease